jgi:hypothetical protein
MQLHVEIFYYINPNKMHVLQSLVFLTTALHVSGVTITHLQEHRTTVSAASGNRYTVLLSAAIVEELGTGLSVLWVAWERLHSEKLHGLYSPPTII